MRQFFLVEGESMKKTLYLIIGIILMACGFLIPTSLLPQAQQILGIFAGALWLWITCSIEIGSLLALAALCLVPDITIAQVVSSSFGNTTIWFLIFSMVLTYALSSSGVLRRVAIYFVDNPLAKKNTYWFMGFYFLSILVLGSFMAPTVSFVLFFGLVKEIYELMKMEPGNKIARNLMIGTGFFASISCALTPIAHTFPLMALGYYETATGEAISYFEYMKYSVPVCLIIAVIAYLLLIYKQDKNLDFSKVSFKNTKWSWQEIVATVVFGLVVICWLLIGIWPDTFAYLNSLSTTWPALIGVIVLAAFGILNIKDAFTKGVAWPAIILCAATLALGKYITADEYGIVTQISSWFSEVNMAFILFIVAAFAVILTNLISNIVTTTVSFNLFVPMILVTGVVSPVLATIVIGVGASLAYALPSSIAHIALAGSSGWANAKDMAKYGFIMVAASIIIMSIFLL